MLLLGLAGLSFGCDDSESARTEEALREAASTWQLAVFEGNADYLWAALADECKDVLDLQTIEESAERGVSAFTELARPQPLDQVMITEVEIRNFTPEAAEAAFLTDNDAINGVSPFIRWVYEDGDWRHPCNV